MRTIDWLDVVFAILLVLIAIKWFPLIGVFGFLTLLCASIKIVANVAERHL